MMDSKSEHALQSDSKTEGRKIHPAFWIVLFFAVLIVLEASFFFIASSQPDDRIPQSAVGQGS